MLTQLENALCSADGLRDVTRIEIEVLRCQGQHKTRWTYWDGSRRLFSAVASMGEVPQLLDGAEVILNFMTGGHDEN